MEVTGKTSLLPRDLRNVLSQVDGKATVGDLHQKLDKFTEVKLIDTLGKLVKDGFVREFVSAPASVSLEYLRHALPGMTLSATSWAAGSGTACRLREAGASADLLRATVS